MLADRNDGYSGLLAVPDLPDRLRRFADRDPLTNLVDHCLGTFFVNITAVQLLPHEAEERAYIGGEAHIVLMKVRFEDGRAIAVSFTIDRYMRDVPSACGLPNGQGGIVVPAACVVLQLKIIHMNPRTGSTAPPLNAYAPSCGT
jgi:hypothetical protein